MAEAPIAGSGSSATIVTAGGEKSSPPVVRGSREKGSSRIAETFVGFFTPNQILSPFSMRTLFLGEVVFFILLWTMSPYAILPRPIEVLQAFGNLWMTQGLAYELASSFNLNLQALGISTVISLVLAYLSALPIFRPVAELISKGRFLSLAGFSLVFTLIFGGGHQLKVSLMVFGMTVFYLTSMLSVVQGVTNSEYDHARTLQMNEWQVLWEVVVVGTLDKALDVLRQNAAMGWMMLTLVEGIVRSEGGLGSMLLAEGKHFEIAAVFAIQGLILFVGLCQDAALGLTRRLLFPYASLTTQTG